MDNLDLEIRDEVFKDKVNRLYNNYKIHVIILLLFIIFVPIFFQFYLYYKKKSNENLFSDYMKAETLLSADVTSANIIFNKLLKSNNETIVFLSLGRLLDFYLENNQKTKAINLLNNTNLKIDQKLFIELKNIKKVISNFETLKENEILKLLKVTENDIFENTKKKLIFDFYIKNNQSKKANQVYQKK